MLCGMRTIQNREETNLVQKVLIGKKSFSREPEGVDYDYRLSHALLT